MKSHLFAALFIFALATPAMAETFPPLPDEAPVPAGKADIPTPFTAPESTPWLPVPTQLSQVQQDAMLEGLIREAEQIVANAMNGKPDEAAACRFLKAYGESHPAC